MSSYSSSLSNSFIDKVVTDFSGPLNTARPIDITALENSRVDETLKRRFDEGLQGLDSPESVGLVKPRETTPPPQNPGWTFITAPEDVSWDIANNAQRVDIFGTNNPPVVAGSRGMRDLTLGNALVEGFMRGVTIEGKVQALENLMNYGFNSSDGFVSVPVYQVWAQDKQYGGPQGYFIIKDVKVKEVMRDTAGWATRAYVDISLMQVPAYQVNSGRDQASEVTAGGVALSPTQKAQATVNGQANQKVTGPGGTAAGAAGSKPSSGANSATPQTKPAGQLPTAPISIR